MITCESRSLLRVLGELPLPHYLWRVFVCRNRTNPGTHDVANSRINSDLLKMDIEFAEFESMDGLSRDFPAEAGLDLPIGQFLVEIHLFSGRQTSKGYLDW